MADQDESDLSRFAGFTVDVTRRQLLGADGPVQLTSKAFETLLILIGRAGETVTKSELMDAVWADTAVEENNLTQQISALRKALGERPNEHRFIVTVSGKGYKFVADVEHGVTPEQNGKLVSAPKVIRRPPGWLAGIDPGAMRGSAAALTFIAVMAFSFAWSIVRDREMGRPQSLAIFNFKVSSSEDEFIGNGISYTLRARLGSVQDLTVRPVDGISADQDAVAEGRRLHVDTVVTGFVQRDHDRIRVAVEMLDVAAGKIVWGGTFDESTSNLFALQDSISDEVARAIRTNFTSRVKHGSSFGAPVEIRSIFRETGYLLFRKVEAVSV